MLTVHRDRNFVPRSSVMIEESDSGHSANPRRTSTSDAIDFVHVTQTRRVQVRFRGSDEITDADSTNSI